MKKLLMALVVAGMSVSPMAQTEEYPVREHSVETNSFWSNWFVSLGGGVQVMPIDRGENGVGLFETLTPNFTVSLGKWFTPGLGLRLQSHLPFYKNELGEQNNGYAVYGQALFTSRIVCTMLFLILALVVFGAMYRDGLLGLLVT